MIPGSGEMKMELHSLSFIRMDSLCSILLYRSLKTQTIRNQRLVIVNQLVNKVNYEVTKQWLDSEENDISDQMAGKKITFVLYRQASNQTSPEKLLTGTADGYADESASTDEATGIVYQEKEPWKASFTNLPRYDSEGHRYDYTVLDRNMRVTVSFIRILFSIRTHRRTNARS